MKIQLDIDEERATRKLTWRERVGVRILLTLFLIIYPCKYPHQVDNMFDDIFNGIELK